jgi:16S rRNA uridine-516 pseudouridylate synthase and related pseudouridylate synthases
VRVHGNVTREQIERLTHGVELDDGPARFLLMAALDDFQIDETEREDRHESSGRESTARANHWFRVAVGEGRNRLVRRLFASQGLEVSRLIRIAYGPVHLPGGIRSAGTRELEPDAVQQLAAAVGLDLPDLKSRRSVWRQRRS